MVTNRHAALDALRDASAHAGEAQAGDYPATMALIGIGHALLDVAAATREQNELIRPSFQNCADGEPA